MPTFAETIKKIIDSIKNILKTKNTKIIESFIKELQKNKASISNLIEINKASITPLAEFSSNSTLPVELKQQINL